MNSWNRNAAPTTPVIQALQHTGNVMVRKMGWASICGCQFDLQCALPTSTTEWKATCSEATGGTLGLVLTPDLYI